MIRKAWVASRNFVGAYFALALVALFGAMCFCAGLAVAVGMAQAMLRAYQ